MIEEYEILAQTFEGAELQHTEVEVKVAETGLFITISKFELSIPYKNHTIHIENEYGTANTGKIEMKMEEGFIPEFEITSQSHLKNIFLIKKGRFLINCTNLQFKLLIEEALINSEMEKIAKVNLFEPHIWIEKSEGSQFLFTEYHLQLKDKVGGLKAIIQFYKNIVDLL